MLKIILCIAMMGLAAGSVILEEKPVKLSTSGSGIIFFTTQKLAALSEFYINRIGCELWLDQGGCRIFRYGNLLLGFCAGEKAELEGMITFFYADKKAVDMQFYKLQDIAAAQPKENLKYRIYHFFARDPEGRTLEFQHFLHPLKWDFIN